MEPLNEYIFFKAYAPYWLRHCKSEVLQGSDNTVFSYSNDLIDMKWDPEQRLWVGDSGQFAEMLPPTQELIDEEFAKEMSEYGFADWTENFDKDKKE